MYGTYFSLNRNGIILIINGWWFSFFKGVNTKKWQFEFTQNVWRKTKTPKPKKLGYYGI